MKPCFLFAPWFASSLHLSCPHTREQSVTAMIPPVTGRDKQTSWDEITRLTSPLLGQHNGPILKGFQLHQFSAQFRKQISKCKTRDLITCEDELLVNLSSQTYNHDKDDEVTKLQKYLMSVRNHNISYIYIDKYRNTLIFGQLGTYCTHAGLVRLIITSSDSPSVLQCHHCFPQRVPPARP